MKTNKSFTKRLRVTKNGKVLARTPGNNHFNAKESSRKKLIKQKSRVIKITAKIKSRFMPHA